MKMSGHFVCFQANSHLQFGSPLNDGANNNTVIEQNAQLLNNIQGEQLNDSSQSFVE